MEKVHRSSVLVPSQIAFCEAASVTQPLRSVTRQFPYRYTQSHSGFHPCARPALLPAGECNRASPIISRPYPPTALAWLRPGGRHSARARALLPADLPEPDPTPAPALRECGLSPIRQSPVRWFASPAIGSSSP